MIPDKCVNSGLLNDDILIKINKLWWCKNKCVNGGLLNDDILIKTNDTCVNVVYWMMILWLKQMCQWWFIEWWYFD